MASQAGATRPYESVVILQSETPIDAQKELFKRNKKIIEDHKGSVVHVDTWGRRLLGNPVDKQPRGVYFHTTFYADNKAVAELERTMRINDRVLRFIHTRLEDGTDLNKFLENFKNELAANAAKEREREAKLMEKRAAAKRAALEGSRGDDEE
ncbi:MAG: 30S ribosomal protein S6 [Bdellovibrionia bacterium]